MRPFHPLPAFVFCVIWAVATHVPPLHAQQAAPVAPAVQIAPIVTEDVTRTAQFVGRVEAIQQVAIKPRVDGFIEDVLFTEGGMVKLGQPLFTIEKDTYQAAVETSQAAVGVSEAQLAAAKANQTKTQLQYDRMSQLRASGTVSQAQLDDATAARDAAVAQVQQANAAIAQAKAQLLTAQINLNYCDIVSPIAGQIGNAVFTVGNLVSPQSGTLATVVQTNPIRVAFSIAESDYLKVAEYRSQHAGQGDKFTPRLKLPDGSTYAHAGEISFINNVVDPNTGTIVVRANFENPDLYLVPGEFVNVNVQLGDTQSLPVVPASAVLQDRNGAYVFVLGEGNRAEERRIKTAQKTSSGWAVTSGVVAGDVIIVSGLQKIRAGVTVNPTNAASAS
ncbi:membrane fusion protein (multidrug efflux system) [Rhodoligotrophos appendicifer]|uniref:efflux RND transporter periplasmic adaptor subunit n=1 Tax=Rhodoligotrophos appendicifer TaxID=987056 RepID=UPI001185B130|nr:efflux RND transporter periplasmic adaptor subunit [Rhodoligotrophos appendicifer]